MKELTIDLGNKYNGIQIVPLSDMHIGDKLCDMDLIKSTIKYIKDTPNAYTIINGDVINNGLKTSKTDSYEEELNVDEQIETAISLLKPIKDKILFFSGGNHEYRTNILAGIDPLKMIALGIGLPRERYTPHMYLLTLQFGRYNGSATARNTYTVMGVHGRRGGGRKPGSTANAVSDLSLIVPNVDLYLHSHTHQPVHLSNNIFIYNKNTKKIEEHTRHYCNTNSFLRYGGYAEMMAYSVPDRTPLVIAIDFKRSGGEMRKHTNILKLRV